jgi:hypothetical protein
MFLEESKIQGCLSSCMHPQITWIVRTDNADDNDEEEEEENEEGE